MVVCSHAILSSNPVQGPPKANYFARVQMGIGGGGATLRWKSLPVDGGVALFFVFPRSRENAERRIVPYGILAVKQATWRAFF